MSGAQRAGLLRGATVWVALLLPTGGCSWAFTHPLPDTWDPASRPVCSTSPVPPAVDSALFLANTGGSIYVATRDVPEKTLAVASGLVEASVWLASAIYGFSKISACETALGDYEHGYHPPPFGTGGEVFTPPPDRPDASRPGG